MKFLRHTISMLVRRVCYTVFSLIPKKKKLVLCNCWFGQKYIDNPKYVFEYLLENSDYDVCWITKSKSVYDILKAEDKPVEYANSWKGIWKQIRAQALFSTVQLMEYNGYLVTNVIHIDLGHGHPIKDPGVKNWSKHALNVQDFYLKHNHFYAICASQFSKEKLKEVLPTIDLSNVFISDFARNDVFIKESLREGKNVKVDEFKKGRKAIVYMPTHRSDGNVVLNMSEILSLVDIQNICERNNYVFIIKKHFYHREEVENLIDYPNIIDITNIDDIDPQILLCQADTLITDYSACYIDYLLLNRPLLFFQYDLEQFEHHERTLYMSFSSLDIAPIAYDKIDLSRKLELLLTGEDQYEQKRNNFAKVYFENLRQDNGCEKVKAILDDLMNKHYPQNK